MDVVRIQRRPAVARLATTALVLVAIAGLAVWAVPSLFAHHAAAQPVVARDSLVLGIVRRGDLVRSVTAAGSLVPDRVVVVASTADGIVADLPVRAGSRVDSGTVIARLENPDLVVAVADVRAQLAAAQADVRSAVEEAKAARLDEDATLRSARAEDARAGAEAHADATLHSAGLIADLQYNTAVIKSSEDRDLVTIARSKVSVGDADAAAKVASAQARADQIAAELGAREAQLGTLVIRAGASGVVQSVAVDPGQRVASGTEFARIAGNRDLKAVLQVAESDVRGVTPGMHATITAGDTGPSPGVVSRIAPAAQSGTVAVDIALDRIPAGARSDQSVDGTIVLGRTPHALSVERPASATDGARITLYRLDAAEAHAYRTEVLLGTGSEDRVRVISGLSDGDRVVVSDLSAFDAPTLRIQP